MSKPPLRMRFAYGKTSVFGGLPFHHEALSTKLMLKTEMTVGVTSCMHANGNSSWHEDDNNVVYVNSQTTCDMTQ